MPKFLTRDEIYNLFQRELPEDVYPFTAPTGAFSSASLDAKAAIGASAYFNLQRIYDNYFPFFTDENISDWFITVFGSPASVATDLQRQRETVVAKLRARSGFTVPEMTSVVQEIVGTSVPVEIVSCEDMWWVISESQLSISTILGGVRMEDAVGPMLCEQSPSDFGKTQAEWDEMREQAYVYEVRIYGYTLTADERVRLDALLKQQEPARSGHIITDSLPLDQMIHGTD